MEFEEKVLEFRTIKKASFDGKSYIVRLPAELVRSIKARGIPVEEIVLEGMWSTKRGTLCVLMMFGKNFGGQVKDEVSSGSTSDDAAISSEGDKESSDDDDYVVLRG